MKKYYIIIFLCFLFSGCKNETKAKTYYLEAISEYKEQNFEKALVLTNNALNCNSRFNQALFLKAKILFFTKQYQEAKQIFIKLTKLKKENFDCKLWLLRCYIFNGELDTAQFYLNELIQLNTEDWRLYYYRAQIARQQNNFEDYFSNLNTADSFLKDSSTVYLDLAFIWRELGLSDRSKSYYSKAETLSK